MQLKARIVAVVLLMMVSRCLGDVLPSGDEYVRSLDGQWDFKLELKSDQGDHGENGQPKPVVVPSHLEPFEKLDYKEDGAWKKIPVPANWEMNGYSVATYNNPDNVIGLYRLEFDVPADWKDRVVKINFDGVQNGAEVYLNGEPVNVDEPSEDRPNFHQGGNTAFQADLTPHVKFGEKNLLAIRVYKNTKEVDLDSGDFFFLGGIHRPVTLFSVPKTHIADLAVKTKVLGEGKAELNLDVDVAGDKQGMMVDAFLEGSPDVITNAGHGIGWNLTGVQYWSAEKPKLYELRVQLKDAGGKVVEEVKRRIGIREVSIKDGILLINNVPVKFTGMCRHEVYPTLGTAINEEVWRKDITMMKVANVNAIRTSHYPYGAKFYDLCDELGMYVMDEMAAGWCDPSDKKLAAAFGQHAREMVRRDKNHASVVVWAIGNENKEGENNRIAADEIRKLDDTRPRLVSWRKGDQYGVELDDLHYTDPPKIAQLNAEKERRKTYPLTFLENPNDWEERNGADYGSLDLWAAVIDRTWQEVWKDDHVPGSFLWEWTDRAVADPYPTKLFDYFPKTGINLVKVKGQTDGFRNPRASLYHVKMAYAPVTVDLKPVISDSSVTIHATNRFSFTDLSELKITWHLLQAGSVLKSGAVPLSLAPRSSGDVRIDLPQDQLSQADALQLDFDHADGTNIATYELRLKPEPDTTPKIDALARAEVKFPRFNMTPVTYGKSPKTGWRTAFRHPVTLTSISIQKSNGAKSQAKDEAALTATPLADVRAVDADLVESDAPGKTVGHLHADFAAGKFSYQVEWTKPNGAKNAPADIQEFGWIFNMPKADDHFAWHRQAYWSWYPSTHIGRASGVATPDSADVDVTKITRPDAFDFNSTKYDCDWATLTDTAGHGLGVTFSPDARQHCRAGINSDGGYQLVVNEHCAPPRDISSGVVPDLYFTLTKGAKNSGSFRVGLVTPH